MLCTDAGVDFRASCFCHKVSIHLGQLCFPAFAPLILSISAQLHCNTHTALSATVVQTKSKLRAMPSGLACKALRAYTAIVDFCCTSCFLPSTYARCLTLLGLHCRKRLTWDMYAQFVCPYSARWELPVPCRCTSKCTNYNDRTSLYDLLTCTGQGILTACVHVLSCMMAEVTVFTQRELCLCRNWQSVRHVGLLLMLLSRLSQLAALCRKETCQLKHNRVWRIQRLTFVVLLSTVCVCAFVSYKKVSFTGDHTMLMHIMIDWAWSVPRLCHNRCDSQHVMDSIQRMVKMYLLLCRVHDWGHRWRHGLSFVL